jgi:hypothetical protein
MRTAVMIRPMYAVLTAVLIMAGLCSPLAAQTPPAPNPTLTADRAQMNECLRQSGGALTSCIGSIAVACVGTTGVDRRAAEPGCARREEAVWRERLNQVLQLTGRPLDAGQRSRLASLHLAWESYVAQKCAFYGSTQPAALQTGRQAGCELREVANRAIELQRAMPRPAQRRPQAPPQIIR